MSVEIYKKIITEPDSAYVLVTNVDDKYEVITGLIPGTTYRIKKVETGKPDVFRTVTLPLDNNNGTPYELPIATATVLGGIKVGEGLEIDPVTGVLSAPGNTTGFAGFTTENIGGTSFPYTTLKKTTFKNIQGFYFNGVYQDKPNADNSVAPDYTITINANGSATISPEGSFDTTKSGQIVYVATGDITDTTLPPAAAGTIAMNDELNTYVFTPPAGESTTPTDYEVETTLS